MAGVLALGVAALAWLFFAGGSGEPSTELTTPTIAADTTTTSEPPSESTSTGDTTTTSQPSADSGATAFVIDATQSAASFEIDEELRGSPNRVVGTTSEVAGQVQVDPGDMSTAQFSQIVINARTFQTDSSFRDRAIRGPIILNSASDEFELITFDVTSFALSGVGEPGSTVQFPVTGDLQIKGTTLEATFDVTVTLTDATTLTGTAQATVLRSDFGIDIPNAPGVANVSDDVLIRLDFVATSG